MSDQAQEPEGRSYGCSYGCGNPYDYVFVSVADSTTEFLCLPCFVKLAADIVAAITSPDAEDVKSALNGAPGFRPVQTPRAKAKTRGHNAPVGTEDDDLLSSFDSTITVDELPPEFK